MSEFTRNKSPREKQEIFKEIVRLIEEEHFTLKEVGMVYGVTKQRIQNFLYSRNYKTCDIKALARNERLKLIKNLDISPRVKENIKGYRKKIKILQAELSAIRTKYKEVKKEVMVSEEVSKLNKSLDELRKSNDLLRQNNFYYKRAYQELKNKMKGN